MAHAIWNGQLSFGLVQIPIGVFPAESREELDFDLLDRRDLQPIGYAKVNKKTGAQVPPGDVVKGYAVAPGRYVLVTEDDFKRAQVESTQRIDISAFVAARDIPPLYFERPYYL